MFVTMSCSDGANRNLARGEDSVRAVEDPMSLEEFETTFENQMHCFLGHAICVCSRVNQMCQGQLYYYTLNDKIHGLSRLGIEIQAEFGHMMSLHI